MNALKSPSGSILDSKTIQAKIFDQSEINASIGSFYWNLVTHELFYSDNFYRLLECEPGEFTPDVDHFNNTFLHPDDKPIIEEARRKTLAEKTGSTWFYRIITKNGKIRYIKAASKSAYLNENHLLIGTIQDISADVEKMEQLEKRQQELKVANIELKTSLKVIQNAELTAGLGHWHINLDTHDFASSENLKEILGVSANGNFTFKLMLDSIHPADRYTLLKNCVSDYAKDNTNLSVFRFIRPDGKIQYLKGSSSKIKIHGTFFIVGILQDITKIIEKEIVLQERNLQLAQQNEALASFNHMASHDLQEPLRKIQLLINLILENATASFDMSTRNYFDRILHASGRMQALISDLLEYSRTNNANVTRTITDLNLILEDTLNEFQEEINVQKVIIRKETLPVLNVIPSQIRQLFVNIIENSLKYMKKGVTPEITIKHIIVPGIELGEEFSDLSLKYHKISFADNGIGFDQEYAVKIFDIFERLHNKNEYSGTGIGLAICKKVLQNHNGFIKATGKKGSGAEFDIYLPASLTEFSH